MMHTTPLDTLSRFLISAGLVLAGAGALLYLIGRIPGLGQGMGKLPGDIFIRKGNFSFYFPVATCVLLSVLLTLVFNLFKKP